MMNPEIKQKWVQALRSGDYQQGKNQLKNHKNQFCCLGVLCDVIKDDIGGYWDENNYFIVNDDARVGVLPVDVVNYSGLNLYNPKLNVTNNLDTIGYHLTQLNDRECYNFNQIADLIEEQL